MLLPGRDVVVRPPLDPNELGFDELVDRESIDQRLLEIVRQKSRDVLAQTTEEHAYIIAADTTVLVETTFGFKVLGQPPEDDSWPETVRGWFRDHLLGRTHVVVTAVRVASRATGAEPLESIVETRITFTEADDTLVDWYVATGEPRGKAGGYALQGAGAIFVDRVEGSPTNVIGLPLRETRELLIAAGAIA